VSKIQERVLHRFHTRLTRNLARAEASLERAQSAPPSPWIHMDRGRVKQAENRVAAAMAELVKYESEHPEE